MRTIRVEFDDESDSESVLLTADDVTLVLDDGLRLVPIRMEIQAAFYKVPDTIGDEEFEEALDDLDWCFKGMAEVEPEKALVPW